MKKKILSIVLTVAMLLSMAALAIPASAAVDTWQASPTEPQQDPSGNYLITNGAELAWVAVTAHAATDYCANKTFILQNNIDLSAKQWAPYMARTASFDGTLDGNGYTIKGMYTNYGDHSGYGTKNIIGLFQQIGKNVPATIKDLTIEFKVRGNIAATTWVGAVAGHIGRTDGDGENAAAAALASKVENVTVVCDIDVDSPKSEAWVGGLFGKVYTTAATIESCSSYGTVTVTRGHGTGMRATGAAGLIGCMASGTLKNCANYASVTGDVTGTIADELGIAGGLIAKVYMKDGATGAVKLEDCINYGTLKASGNDSFVGGMIGDAFSFPNGSGTTVGTGTIELNRCVNVGTLTYEDTDNDDVGGVGLIGNKLNTGENRVITVKNCITNSALILGASGAYTGTYADDSENMESTDVLANNLTGWDLDVTTLEGASIRLAGETSGIRFHTTVDPDAYTAIQSFGAKLTIGTMIAPTSYFETYGTTHAELAKAPTAINDVIFYNDAPDSVAVSNDWFDAATREYTGAIGAIQEDNFNLAYTGLGYVTVTVVTADDAATVDVNEAGSVSFTLYSDYNSTYSRTVADVAVAAYNDRVDTQNGTSLCGLAAKYEVAAEHVIAGKGNYSPYNTANLTMIKAYADKKAS